MIKTLQRMITSAISRVIVKSIADSGIQLSQVTGLVDEELEEVERVQNYGFNSWPDDGAQGVMVSVGGDKDLAVIISADFPKARRPVEKTEACLYTAAGNFVHLKKNGSVQIGSKSTVSIKGQTDELVSLLVDLVTALTNVTTTTAIGPQPFVNLAEFTALKTKFSAFKE